VKPRVAQTKVFCLIENKMQTRAQRKRMGEPQTKTSIEGEIRRLTSDAEKDAKKAQAAVRKIEHNIDNPESKQRPQTEEEKELESRKMLASFMPGSGVPTGGW
jgi:uncharacterized protein YlxW (UPF0749 family)